MMRFTLLTVTAILMSPYLPASEDDSSAAQSNRLSRESSPYLLLHAHNPVDWYPWGPEALSKARSEGKPIFLSVGYSSCYWCHVMERKVFSDPEIAKYMNEHFVNVKVDREERPDIDDIYMTSLIVYQQLSGANAGGGWPLSMFLTPDGNPIAGATYMPPADSPTQGLGFPSVARRVVDLWTNRKPDLERSGLMITEQVQKLIRPGLNTEAVAVDSQLLAAVAEKIQESYDPVWGGVDFNRQRPESPRFPNVPRLEFALDLSESGEYSKLNAVVEHSLERMALGGIRDHLSGGFHRYSTDRKWHVPHFEKMLYDQAMLLGVYSRAASRTGKPLFAEVAAEIAEFVQSELVTADGAFCSALDAETNAIEGEYYVWSREEVFSLLTDVDANLFSDVYGMNSDNPFEHGFVLHLSETIEAYAEKTKQDPIQLKNKLKDVRATLLKARSDRERPLLDDKVLTAWNALMIRALAYSGRSMDRPQDIAAAEKAGTFLLDNLRNDDGTLMRTWRNGQAKYDAYLEDYAFLVAALLELHTSTGKQDWLVAARELTEKQVELFYDESLSAFYFTSRDHEKLIARTSSVYDSVFPSANSVSVANLLRLNEFQRSEVFATIAEDTLKRFAPSLMRSPASCAGLARAIHDWLNRGSDAALQSRSTQIATDTVSSVESKAESIALHRLVHDESQEKSGNAVPHFAFRPVLQVDKQKSTRPLKVRILPLYDKLPRKGKCLIAIELQVKPGWHVNANPSNPDFLVPTKVELKSGQKVKLTKVKYPKHHELKVQGSPTPYHVYDGKQIVYGLLEIDEKPATKFSELEFHVSFQGCNSTQCLQPDKIVLKGKLPIAKDGEQLKKINTDKHPKLKNTKQPEKKPKSLPDPSLSRDF